MGYIYLHCGIDVLRLYTFPGNLISSLVSCGNTRRKTPTLSPELIPGKASIAKDFRCKNLALIGISLSPIVHWPTSMVDNAANDGRSNKDGGSIP